MSRVIVNNGFKAFVTFPFGWSGEVGVVRLEDRYQVAYQSTLAPPIGHEMTLGSELLVVRHVQAGTGKNPITILTLTQKGVELPSLASS